MMKTPRVLKSAVDGKYYHAAGTGKTYQAAGIVTPDDIADIEAVTILDEVLGLARPQYRLRKMCRPITMDSLTTRIDIATNLIGTEKVKPLVEAPIASEAYEDIDFDLWKNVVHVAMAVESEMRSAHNLMQLHTEDAARDLARMENKQIAEAAEAGITEKVGTAGNIYADWATMTAKPYNDTNPLLAITASMNYILGKGYPPDFIALHPTLQRKFVLNTWIENAIHKGTMKMNPDGNAFKLIGYPEMKIIVDPALTELPTSSVGPIIGSSQAPGLVLGQGPTSAAKYKNEPKSINCYIIRQWLEPKVVLDDALDMICT